MQLVTLYKYILTGLLAFGLMGLPAISHAQETAPAQKQTEAQTEPVQAETAPAIAAPSNVYDLDDPAIARALAQVKAADAAREQANQALADAVLSQRQEVKLDESAPENAPAKNSLIPTNAQDAKAAGKKLFDKAISWLTSPSFLAQIAAIALAYFLSPVLAKAVNKRASLFQNPPAKDAKLRIVRDYIYQSRNFLRAVMLVALLALFAIILKAVPMLGQDWLVKLAQGLAVVFLLFKAIKQFISNPLFQKAAIWIIIPLAVLMVFGYYDDFIAVLNNTELMTMAGTPITAMTLVRLVIFGSIFFKLGGISNTKGQDAIRAQETLDPSTREVAAKIFQILLFVILIVLVLGAAKIPLSGLVMIFSAVGLGIGFGLQPIAANFISGLIILFDRSVKVGDFINTADDQFGRIKAINMRSTTVGTADGKDIIVPNTKFTEDAYENWTHDSPLQRYEVDFGVSYDTDLDALVPIIMNAVLEHPDVLGEPDLPSVEFRSFGDSAIDMCVEFWCRGVDDGPNKFTSDVGFIIWRTLKAHNIEIPFPQRVVRNIK